MILIDSRVGSKELLPKILMKRAKAELSNLGFGDLCFEGNGPGGKMLIGVERKTLHDMLHCIDDSRYTAHQLPGMLNWYGRSYLLLEGLWKPHDESEFLMQGFRDGSSWGHCNYRTKPVLYSKLRRYLFSLSLAGVDILYTRDLTHSAIDVLELFNYWQKRWEDHTSLREVQRVALPTFHGKVPLVRKWAADIDDIGVKYSERAETLFKTPIKLAQADELQWMRIDGIGAKTAKKIISQVWGMNAKV